MSMEQILGRAAESIRSGHLSVEAQVRTSIIVPILRELDWDDTNPMEFVPEFLVDPTENRRVDFALCRAVSNQPLVFIEAKKLGGADTKGEEQLFGYAANRGVPFLILTDGNIWNFYLSMEEGTPAERRFYRGELLRTEKISEYAQFLREYMRKDLVFSGDAKSAAEKRLRGNREKEKARRTIPIVWNALLKDPNEILRDLLAEEVEVGCGTKPDIDDVEAFLVQMSHTQSGDSSISQSDRPKVTKRSSVNFDRNKKIVGFTLYGESTETQFGNRALAELLVKFQDMSHEFMDKFASQTKGRTRRLVAKSRDDLYDQSDLVDFSLDLKNGWWLGTNISTSQVRRHIKTACQIAGVKFGSELTLIER